MLHLLIYCLNRAQPGIVFQKVMAAFTFSLKCLKRNINNNEQLGLFYFFFKQFLEITINNIYRFCSWTDL